MFATVQESDNVDHLAMDGFHTAAADTESPTGAFTGTSYRFMQEPHRLGIGGRGVAVTLVLFFSRHQSQPPKNSPRVGVLVVVEEESSSPTMKTSITEVGWWVCLD